MTTSATVVNQWHDGINAYLVISIPNQTGNIESPPLSTPLTGTDENGNPVTYTNDQLAASLQSLATAWVTDNTTPITTPLTLFTGPITV